MEKKSRIQNMARLKKICSRTAKVQEKKITKILADLKFPKANKFFTKIFG